MHLNELQDKYGDKGLVMLSVCREPRSNVDAFVKKTNCKTPIMIEETDTHSIYGHKGIPAAYLLDPRGRIVWSGMPGALSDAEVEKWLEGVKLAPSFPKKLSSIRKAFQKEKFADARKKANAIVTKAGDDEEALNAAKATIEWIDWWGESGLEDAGKDAEAKKYFDAWQTYEDLGTTCKGLPASVKAKEAMAALMKDDDAKDEIKAGQKWAKLSVKIRDLSKKKALRLLEPFVKKYGKFKSAARANDALTRLKKSK